MSNGRLTAAAAVAHVQALLARGHRVLGIDGFRVVPGGHLAALDLILDLSGCHLRVEEAASQALAFIEAHAGDDVLFEVVSDDT